MGLVSFQKLISAIINCHGNKDESMIMLNDVTAGMLGQDHVASNITLAVVSVM